MPVFIVTGELTISVWTRVEAASAKDAVREARERAVPGLCHQCATGAPDDEWSTSGELDGEPTKLTAEKES